MIRTTFYKLKKACYSLTFAPRVLLRGELRETPGKFQKLSIAVLRKAEKSTAPGDKDEECEKCKKLIELIFGPSNPEAVQSVNKTELPETDIHYVNEAHKENQEGIIASQGITNRVISEKIDKEVSDMPIDTHIHATAGKQAEEGLNQKIEVINETPVVEAEIPKTEGFNTSPKILGNVQEIQSFQQYDNRKWDEIDDIRVHPAKQVADADDTTMRDTIENLVRKIEETYRSEGLRKQEEVKRVERALSKEIERSDFKLPIYNFASDRQNRKSGGAAEESRTYDELAKRCLDAPNNKIDERILKEMEKLGVPPSSSRGESSVMEENVIQIDLKKPKKPTKKTEIDLETREFERDPPIAYIDKLHPAFQMTSGPKAISKEYTNTEVESGNTQMYEIDNKPVTYSEDAQTECANLKSEPYVYDTSRVIIDPYDKRSIACDNEVEEYDPLWYERYTIRQEKILDMNNEEEPSEMPNPYTYHNQLQYSQTETNAQNSPVDSLASEHSREVCSPIQRNELFPNKNQRASEQLSFKPEHVAAVAAETNLKDDEIIQLSVVIDPNEAGRVSCEPRHAGHEKPSFVPEKTVESKTSLTNFEEVLTKPDKSNEFERASVKPENKLQGNTAAHMNETYQLNAQPPTIDPSTSKNFEYNYHVNSTYNSMNAPKHPDETYRFITRPEPTPTSNPAKNHNVNQGFETAEVELLPESNNRSKPFQYSTPPETVNNNKQDVTYIEPKAKEDKPEYNPNLTPEQISHSFIQPQSMVNPLVDNPLKEPSDKIQKSMSACSLPNLKPQEDLSLSEMLKRVRLRNRMEYCQAFDRQLGQMEPVTGKCGKKTPPCPPPAPKCPQCPPPPCPPPPPPCPKPCKPACPPPCPPPCPKKDPCSKFKKHLPTMNLKNIISLLLQPTVQHSQEPLNLCVRISDRSHAHMVREMSVKLQEIGLNLLIAYPGTSIKISSDHGETVTLARDYEPWVPIPSWPIPKKEIKKPFVCPKEGCKLIPPPKLRPACNENPCINFPKRSNSFSIAKLFSF